MADLHFEEFEKKFFDAYLNMNPQTGTYLGLHEYDGRTGDVTEAGMSGNIQNYREFLKRLETIDRNTLSASNKYDFDVAKWSIESELFELEEMQSHRKNPRYYISIFSGLDDYIKRDYAPFDERLRSIIDIIDIVPETLDEAKTNLGKSIPAVLCRYAAHSCEGFRDFFETKLLDAIKERTDDIDLIGQYMLKSKEAVEAFRDFGKHIESVSSDTDESYKLGKEKFLKMLSVKEHIDMPLDELRRLGAEELNKLRDGMNKLIADNNFQGKLDRLEHDHPTEENLISETGNMLDGLVNFIREKDLVDLPEKLNCIVTEMPKYDDFGFASMGTAGPFEKSDESFYYVNLPDKDWDDKKKEEWLTQFNYPTLKLISIHEAYPGHYTHFLNANKKSTRLSKLFMSYSYVEGWAHYSEEMMIEQGYGEDDFRTKIGMYIEALIRCCRYIVAIEMHCGNMSIEEAKEFFVKNAYMAETTALNEAERGCMDPGYLNYTLGKILLKQFRTKYFDKYKSEKTLKDFHNQVVSLGCPTFKIAEGYILN